METLGTDLVSLYQALGGGWEGRGPSGVNGASLDAL
jgi:hypothetical protein